MPTCSYCDAHFWFGGVSMNGRKFCNAECQYNGSLLDIAEQLPSETVSKYVADMRKGDCPKCGGPGPVEVHTSYRVYSYVVATSWSNRPRISCKACARKAQLSDMAMSAALGWWGVPWGLLMTPVQIGRNVAGLMSNPNAAKPSPLFVKILKLNLASQLVAQQQGRAAQAT